MFRLAMLASLVAGCGDDGSSTPDVDAGVSAACVEATTYSNLAKVEEKIFKQSCIFSGCHNGGATDAGRLDLRMGASHVELVNIPSEVDPGRMLVVPGDAAKSYLLVMLGEIRPQDADPPTVAPPSEIGLMPQATGGALLCPEKRDAVERWIVAGALND